MAEKILEFSDSFVIARLPTRIVFGVVCNRESQELQPLECFLRLDHDLFAKFAETQCGTLMMLCEPWKIFMAIIISLW